MHFQDVIINSSKPESEAESGSEEEPRFSFFQGGYVEDRNTNGIIHFSNQLKRYI